MLQFMGLQRVGHDWATELNWMFASVLILLIFTIINANTLTERKLHPQPNMWIFISTHSEHILLLFSHQVVSPSCNPMNCSTPGFPVFYSLPEFGQTHVHWVRDAIQTSYPLSPASSLALNPSQHQDLFQWISFSHQVVKVLELQHQPFQWIFRVDFL